MNIRPVTKNDFNEWLQLWKGYQVFYKAAISDEITKTTFDRFQDAQEPVYCLVIENEEKQLIGLVHYIFHRSTWTIENYCYLQDLFVDPKHRASGLGRKLIEAVYAEAEKNHCSRVYWLTQENNEQARMLYDRIADQTSTLR